MSGSGTNKIVSSLVNEISWVTDDASYQKAKKKIISLKAAHEKPAKALEKAQKRTAQSEGKAALAAAKAQTAKLRQAEQLSKQQQKQAQIQAKMERDAVAHANKMTSLQARQLSQQERQNARLAAISAKVQAAARSRAMTYNPNMPGVHSDPSLVARQTEAMNRGHGAVAVDIAATKKAIALEEKRQREKEASLKRQSTAYDTLRRASLTISHIEGASLADKMKAVQVIKEATKGYSEQRYTIAEMRHELAKATLETRRQARINRQMIKDRAKAERAGRVNVQRLRRERSERGYGAVYNTVVDDSANSTADWIKQKTGFDPRSIGQTLKQIYPWLDSSAPSNIGSGTAYNAPALALNVPGLNYLTPQQPMFTVPTIDSMTQRQPIPVSVTGQAEIKLSPLDVNVNDGAINGLIDTKLRSYEQAQNNMILGIAQ